ncbi:MAG TPA: dTDP-4-dehydrorhamnose reductase [Candidatus Hydrothermia bacterium]|nr:dTDP-4-dehydrorhamnose reductase [Candidatus Hydrothermia bacterium]
MRFLIFGSRGQLGRELTIEVIRRGFCCTSLSREEADVTDHQKVRDIVKSISPDIIINATAYNDVDQAELEPDKAFAVNSHAVRNLAKCAEEVKAILVHFSSDYVFDGKKGSPYTTLDEPHPINVYGKSKLEGEQHVIEIMRRCFIVRVSWLFGFGKANFPLKLLEMAKKQKTIKVAIDQINSPTYTVDAAKGVMELILKGKFGLYHVVNKGYCSRFEWAQEILRLIKWPGEIQPGKMEDFPGIAKRPRFTALDTTKFERETGFFLPSWRDAVERFLCELGEGGDAV